MRVEEQVNEAAGFVAMLVYIALRLLWMKFRGDL